MKVFHKLANVSMAAALLGGLAVALPNEAMAIEQAPTAVAAKATRASNTHTERVTVKAGNQSIFDIPVASTDGTHPVKYRFQGYPLNGIKLDQAGHLIVNLPETQTPGVHRVTVRVSQGGATAFVKYIVTILPANS